VNNKIDINIQTKDRIGELYGLLVSLRNQTYSDWDLYILDDASSVPIQSNHIISCILQRLQIEGHRVMVIRNNKSKGLNSARQQLVDFTLNKGEGEFICRIDDDSILELDYLTKLISVIDKGYDLASGVVPHFAHSSIKREIKFVSPIINQVSLDDKGNFVLNCDDCGHEYLDSVILPAHHFRSSALYKKSIHKKVNYEYTLTTCGFREEEFFSFRCILEGFKLGVHTTAIAWHLATPSGGDRRNNYQDLSIQNQRLLNRFVKAKYKEHGDFIKSYNQSLKVSPNIKQSINKNNNLIYSREE